MKTIKKRISSDIPEDVLIKIWNEYDILLISADTGLGKTTHIPVFILNNLIQSTHPSTQVWVLEPRRAAAQLSAMRVASLLDVLVGDEEVGYETRFDSKVQNHSPHSTKLRYLTYGVFLKKFTNNQQLKEVHTIILDEFHERSAEQDLALSFLLNLKANGIFIRIILMSATLSNELLSKIQEDLAPAKLKIKVGHHHFEGKKYSVESVFLPTKTNPISGNFYQLIEEWGKSILRAHHSSLNGDTLVFLPGMKEIRRIENFLSQADSNIPVHILHGDINPSETAKLFQLLLNHTDSRRSIILSTNIAETSLTLPNVTRVVDSGLSRVARYQINSGDSELFTVLSPRSSIIQRKGRAGRTQEGVCFHLYADVNSRIFEFDREILLRPLYSEVLLSHLIENWIIVPDWLSSSRAIIAQNYLLKIGAIHYSDLKKITIAPLGRVLLNIPLHIRLARVFCEVSSIKEIEILATLNEGECIQFQNQTVQSQTQHQIQKTIKYLSQNIINNTPNNTDMPLVEKLYCGYFDRVAKNIFNDSSKIGISNETKYKDFYGQVWSIPEKINFPYILILLTHGNKNEIIDFLPITEEQILFHSMSVFENKKTYTFSESTLKVECLDEDYLGSILFESRRLFPEANLETHSIILELMQKKDLSQKLFDQTGLSEFVMRTSLVLQNIENKDSTKVGLFHPLIDNRIRSVFGLLKSIPTSTWKEFEDTLLGLHQTENSTFWMDLEKFYPRFLKLPRGRTLKIHYENTGIWVESRLQDFIGLTETPTVGKSTKTPLQLRLLAPNYRPVQITTDINSFWKNTYPEIRGALSRRYPKHEWPSL